MLDWLVKPARYKPDASMVNTPLLLYCKKKILIKFEIKISNFNIVSVQ